MGDLLNVSINDEDISVSKHDLHYKFLWSRNGNIYIRKDTSPPIININSLEDVKKLNDGSKR